jgi:hypothetical protein
MELLELPKEIPMVTRSPGASAAPGFEDDDSLISNAENGRRKTKEKGGRIPGDCVAISRSWKGLVVLDEHKR